MRSSVIKVASFLGRSLSDDVTDLVVEKLTFENMQKDSEPISEGNVYLPIVLSILHLICQSTCWPLLQNDVTDNYAIIIKQPERFLKTIGALHLKTKLTFNKLILTQSEIELIDPAIK